DIPPPFLQYKRDDVERPFPLPKPTMPTGQEEQVVERQIDDARVTDRYRQWWVAHLRVVLPRPG
ncbi:hypothetical protein KI387_039970, partial [Taxus chinensis]